jgi:predicted dehydrogenase
VYGYRGRLTKEDLVVEDNGLVVMTYPRGMAISEGSWSQAGDLTSYVTAIYGACGTLLVEPKGDGRLWLADDESPAGRLLDVPPPGPDLRNATEHFAARVRDGGPFFPLCHERMARDAQEILEAALRSSLAGTEVSLPIRDHGVARRS